MKISYSFNQPEDIRNIMIEESYKGFRVMLTCFGCPESREWGYTVKACKEEACAFLGRESFLLNAPLTEKDLLNLWNGSRFLYHSKLDNLIKEAEDNRTEAILAYMEAMEKALEIGIENAQSR